jgi:hypothetical protein
MEDSLDLATKKLIDALQDFSNALKGGKSMEQQAKTQPETKSPERYPDNNVHRLLRIVWVFVKNCNINEVEALQDQLPVNFARDHGVSEAEIHSETKTISILKREAEAALADLYEVLGEPWKGIGNPCEGAWPRRIRG